MKNLLLIAILFGLHSTSFAHKYYFGFAEVDYDYFSQRFEATLTVTAHDLELALNENGKPAGDLDDLDSLQSGVVENYINSSFKISSNGAKCRFKLVGHDANLNGEINFYLESSEIVIKDSIDVEFDILMDNYSEQQNKITLYYLKRAYTLSFTRRTKKQTILIVKTEE